MATPINLDEFKIPCRAPQVLKESNQNKNIKAHKNKTNKSSYLSTPLLSPKSALRTAIVSIKTQQRRHRDRRELSKNFIPVGDSGKRANRVHRNWLKFPEKSIAMLPFTNLNQTWSSFLERYGNYEKNLSNVPRPACFNGSGLMIPPEAHNESRRIEAVKNYIDKKQWKESSLFDSLLKPLMLKYQVSGLSISLIDRTKQLVKYQIGLPIEDVSRSISIDGHAILSKDYFVLLNASRDWRMAYNPFVHGPPFIRFYAAVPLITPDGYPIGAISIFDPYVRPRISEDLIRTLTDISKTISDFISAEASRQSPRIESASSRDEKSSNIPNGNSQVLGTNKNIRKKFSYLSIEDQFPELLHPNNRLDFDLRSFKGLKHCPTLVQSYQILNELKDCPDGKSTISKAASTLAEALGLKVVYVVEARITSSYETRVSQFPFATGHKFAMDTNIDDICPVHAVGTPDISISLIGGHNIQRILHSFDNKVHKSALDSLYGIQYSSTDDDITYKSAIFMPFQRMPAKVVYRARRSKPNKGKPTDSSSTVNASSDDATGSGRASFYSTASQPINNSDPKDEEISCKSNKSSPIDAKVEIRANSKYSARNKKSSGKDRRSQKLSGSKDFAGISHVPPGSRSKSGESVQISASEKTKGTNENKAKTIEKNDIPSKPVTDELLKIKLRKSGFVMAGFRSKHGTFSPTDIEYMKVCARALESVLACSR